MEVKDSTDVGDPGDSESFKNFLHFLHSTRSSSSEEDDANTGDRGDKKKGGSQSQKELVTSANGDKNMIMWTFRSFFFTAAFLLALLPSVLKIYETSHWFREGDPSVYDNAKDWFSNESIPLQSYFDNSKVLMRVYFFIVPYIASALCATIGLIIPSAPAPAQSRHLKTTGSFLRRTLSLPPFLVRMGFPVRVSVAEVFGITIFLTLNIMTIAVRVRRSLPRGSRKIEFLVDSDKDASREPIDPISWQASEVWAKTLGVISILNLGWYLLMPVGRKSVLLEALNISWERAIKYHRWVGYYSVVLMFVHSVMYVAIWSYGDSNPSYDPNGGMAARNMIPWHCSTNECDEDTARMLRRNMYGFVTLFLILVMTAFTIPWIRRHKFEWFFYVHHLFILVLIFVSLHYKGAVVYLLPGIALYGVDKLMALYSYHKSAPVEIKMLSSDVLEVSFFTGPGVSYKAGDYVFLNVPEVSFLEWHPFSITSAPSAHGNRVFFHLKGMGSGSWTNKVLKQAAGCGSLQVRLDGFYGVNNGICDQLQTKDGVILVGGGIGVTPMMSLAAELCKTSHIPLTVMWVVRNIDEFSIFSTELNEAQRTCTNFKAKAWITLSTFGSTDVDEWGFDKAQLCEFNNFSMAHKSTKDLIGESIRDLSTNTPAAPFVLEQPGLSGASNAAVMTISSFFALIAYALASKISNNEAHADTTQDFISLMELSMVYFFVFLWVALVIIVRRALPKKDVLSYTDETGHTMTNTTGYRSASVSASDEEVSQSDHELLESIVQGNIGSRPNMPEELWSFATTVAQKLGRPADIAVMACGPPKLVESINNYINVPSSISDRGVEKSNQANFSFIEEDWEW